MVLDPDPNDMPHDNPDGCPLCGIVLGLALTLLIAGALYSGIRYFELSLPSKILAPHK